MTRSFRIPVLLAVLCLAACSASPRGALEKMQEAARAGKAQDFASHFSEESRPFALALMSLYATQGSLGSQPSKPLDLLTRCEVVDETIVSPERADVTVKSGERTSVLVFVLEGSEWKLDVHQTDRRNADREP
jgi:hypothetical protein